MRNQPTNQAKQKKQTNHNVFASLAQTSPRLTSTHTGLFAIGRQVKILYVNNREVVFEGLVDNIGDIVQREERIVADQSSAGAPAPKVVVFVAVDNGELKTRAAAWLREKFGTSAVVTVEDGTSARRCLLCSFWCNVHGCCAGATRRTTTVDWAHGSSRLHTRVLFCLAPQAASWSTPHSTHASSATARLAWRVPSSTCLFCRVAR